MQSYSSKIQEQNPGDENEHVLKWKCMKRNRDPLFDDFSQISANCSRSSNVTFAGSSFHPDLSGL